MNESSRRSYVTLSKMGSLVPQAYPISAPGQGRKGVVVYVWGVGWINEAVPEPDGSIRFKVVEWSTIYGRDEAWWRYVPPGRPRNDGPEILDRPASIDPIDTDGKMLQIMECIAIRDKAKAEYPEAFKQPR